MAEPKLVKSTSGIRGVVGNGLDPVMVTAYGAAFGTFLRRGKVVVGRDTRPSGDIFSRAVISGLVSVGIDVIEVGIVPTPTVEIAVKALRAAGGICITASHNPAEWNAIKFFNDRGEFITAAQYRRLDRIFESGRYAYKPVSRLGSVIRQDHWIDEHVTRTLSAKAVNLKAIKRYRPKIVIDAINGAGSEAMPRLLHKLGARVVEINCRGDGNFVHEPEPTAANLAQLGRAVKRHKADLGMACDPDADRLALVDEYGRPIGEELTLAIAVGHVLRRIHGPTVINLSTSRTTADIADSMGSRVYRSKVGEANVVAMMHKRRAVIGGEGNGGVIYPSFHTGRDALIAAALVLSALAEQKKSLATLVETFPRYYTIKSKASLPGNFAGRMKRLENDARSILGRVKIDRRDGLRFDFENGWLQIRSSNTEPIFRLIVETSDRTLTGKLSREVMRYFR